MILILFPPLHAHKLRCHLSCLHPLMVRTEIQKAGLQLHLPTTNQQTNDYDQCLARSVKITVSYCAQQCLPHTMIRHIIKIRKVSVSGNLSLIFFFILYCPFFPLHPPPPMCVKDHGKSLAISVICHALWWTVLISHSSVYSRCQAKRVVAVSAYTSA